MDFGLFKSMSARDFFTQDSPKRTALINHANLVTYWVVDSVVMEEHVHERMKNLKKLLEVAECLQGPVYKNLHGFMAIMCALQMSTVSRLKKTWAEVNKEQPGLLKRYREELMPLADPGNGIYSNVLDRVTGPNAMPSPCVPFLGSFLTAIERAKTKGKNQDGGDDVAAAARIQGDVAASQQKLLKRIPALQKGQYDWEAMNLVPRFDDFLRTELPSLFDISSGKTRNELEDKQMKESLLREPRES